MKNDNQLYHQMQHMARVIVNTVRKHRSRDEVAAFNAEKHATLCMNYDLHGDNLKKMESELRKARKWLKLLLAKVRLQVLVDETPEEKRAADAAAWSTR